MKKNTVIIIAIVSIILGGVVGYFIGSKYQGGKRTGFNQAGFGNRQNQGSMGNQQGNENGQMNRQGMGGGMTTGEIINKDDSSITIKMTDGSSKIIMVADNTTISKSATATKADLKVGEKVAVFGVTNSDGTMTANNIQLNPQTKSPQQ